MAQVQTRRSISFALADFEAARQLAERLGVPIAQLAAHALRELIARNPTREEIAPAPPVPEAPPVEPPPPPVPVPPEPTPDLARELQPELDAMVGVLTRPPRKPEPFDLPALRRDVDLEQADPDAGEVQVVYDDGAQRRPRVTKRKGR